MENDTPQNVHDAVNSTMIRGNVEKAVKVQLNNSPNNTRAALTQCREADIVDLTIDDDEESPRANRSSSGFVERRLAATAVKDAEDVQRANSPGEQRQEHEQRQDTTPSKHFGIEVIDLTLSEDEELPEVDENVSLPAKSTLGCIYRVSR